MTEITQEDILRYHYGETSDQKSAAIKAAIKGNSKVKESVDELNTLKQTFDKLVSGPSDDCVNRILKYGKQKQQSRVQTH